MQKTAQALAAASSIVTHFRFVVRDGLSAEAARFNEHFVDHKAQAESVERQLRSMRGHCSVIEKHAEKIKKDAAPTPLSSLAAALGLASDEEDQKVAAALRGIYNDELQYHLGVQRMTQAIKLALGAVQDALGPPGVIDPARVPDAAAVLGEYSIAFAELEATCNNTVLQLQESIDAL